MFTYRTEDNHIIISNEDNEDLYQLAIEDLVNDWIEINKDLLSRIGKIPQ